VPLNARNSLNSLQKERWRQRSLTSQYTPSNLEHSAGLYLYDTNLTEEMASALISKNIHRDFDDALQYYVAKKLGADAIVSFDEHFDGLDIRRAEPRDLLPKMK